MCGLSHGVGEIVLLCYRIYVRLREKESSIKVPFITETDERVCERMDRDQLHTKLLLVTR